MIEQKSWRSWWRGETFIFYSFNIHFDQIQMDRFDETLNILSNYPLVRGMVLLLTHILHQIQKLWGLLGLAGDRGWPEVPQGCRHCTSDSTAWLQVAIFVSNVFIFISGLPAKHSRRRSFSSWRRRLLCQGALEKPGKRFLKTSWIFIFLLCQGVLERLWKMSQTRITVSAHFNKASNWLKHPLTTGFS